MGRGEIDKAKGDKVEATLCPNCSFEHVIVPMFRKKNDHYHCLMCRNDFQKRVNGRTVFIIIDPDASVEFEADFEV